MSDIHSFVSERALRDYDRLHDEAVSIDLGEFSLIELAGEDRKGWLQGQATNDVKSLTSGNSRSFCFCEANGSLLAVMDAWALSDRIVSTTARDRANAVLDRVERMTILEDVVARDLSSDVVGLSIQGPAASRDLAELLPLPALDAHAASIDGAEVLVLRSRRTALGGWDVWMPAGNDALKTRLLERFPTASSEAVEAARLEAGIPRWGMDMGERTLPPELGSTFEARHVSYNKGCYTGQEVLMRMHSRGHTNKTWVGLVAESPLRVGEDVSHRGKVVGTVASIAHSPDFGPIGAAVLRNEAAHLHEAVTISGQAAEVRPMPILRLE